MFDIGFAELLMIAVVALLVLGPEKLPTAIRTLGLWLGRAKRTVSSIQSEISEELRIEEMRRTAAIKKEALDKELSEMKQPFGQAFDDESPLSQSAKAPESVEQSDTVSPSVAKATPDRTQNT